MGRGEEGEDGRRRGEGRVGEKVVRGARERGRGGRGRVRN